MLVSLKIIACSFMIVNRRGEKVFETNDLNQCRNSRYKDHPADIGGYVIISG